jgi:hypothetical protein
MSAKTPSGWAVFVAALCLGVGVAQQQKPSAPAPHASPPPEQAKVPPPVHLKPRPRVISDLSKFELSDPKKLAQRTMYVAATRGLAPWLVALAPELGKLYVGPGAPAIFTWSYPQPQREETWLVLTDQSGAEIFRRAIGPAERQFSLTNFQADTGNAFHGSVSLPGSTSSGERIDIELVAAKTYSWRVQLDFPTGPIASAPAGFIVVSEKENQEIEAALRGIRRDESAEGLYRSLLLRARVFTKFRLWYNASGAYTELIARYPSRAELYEDRGQIYAQLPATRQLADEDFSRADELEVGKATPSGK